ncbi:efflux RND transporter permease subunit [Parabacteroides chinchillae]|uniref:Multidrug efflux pump subunit AcrB n=1 Tax=Parabacteroides chinchillae TaxID=871327 RepID=A0A8G2BYZ6_9BACT|nr:efflux RND transporter permease subunit [Parabacteroides chinchillae]SEG26442.1 Multidrug efflux pump subunit AcrB [Parabacteroides chinchillae]
MIKFLLQRPIAVLMAFTAFFIIGLVTYFTIPISLLPDIAIPEITVQVAGQNTSARELENTVVKPIRQQLMQVAGLKDVHSETRDGASIIRLNFEFGTNTDLAFIEVNEKIDAAMNYLPKEIERPRVIKASATDIPVFYLNLTLKTNENEKSGIDESAFLDLCQFAETVIKRRIEQLPEVAMVDITGIQKRQLQIVPDMKLMKIADITLDELESALNSNNIEPGSMVVRDGYYEYNIKFSTLLRTPEDVQNIYIRKNGRIFQLKDLANIAIVPEKETGLSLAGNKRAVTLAVIKQSDENMDNMKEALKEVTDYFASVYPDIEFSITRNQTELLDYTISNLKQNLSLGFIFICIVAILFLGDVKSPAVIGLSIIVSLTISFLFFYLCNMSLNIISLSGLILALGMMIDSSIVVTENITQYRAKGDSLEEACIKGTTEVITPMLSSTFTTIAVFLPLVFMSGIAGAIFYDQAFAVTVGLMVSYFTGIMLLPILYKLVYSIPEIKHSFINLKINNLVKEHTLDRFYDGGVDFIFDHKRSSLIFVIITVPLCVVLFYVIPKSRMPEIDQNELIVHLEWNENIHIDENRKRVSSIFAQADKLGAEHTAYIGQQQFLLNRDRELSVSEAELYLKTLSTKDIAPLQSDIQQWIKQSYPNAVVSFAPPETVFEKLFVTGEADIVTELYTRNKTEAPVASTLFNLEKALTAKTGILPVGIAFDDQLNISIDRQKLLLYNVDYNEVYKILKTAFKENEVTTLRSYQQYLPITLAGNEQSINQVLSNTLIRTSPAKSGEEPQYIPLQSLVHITQGEDLKTITAGKNGEYIPFSFYNVDDAEHLMGKVKETVQNWDVDFSGSFFSNKQMLNELVIILFISLLLMYFILAAQFESFLQPLIVLLEIPIDVAAALLVLWLCGHSLNLMSAIGIVVTCGIVINDSILKLDAINELRKEGRPLMESIHEAGRRRLRPIIMTSLTTIFGMVPLLFSFDMGSELQKPLSIAMISAMLLGTAVSLFVIPLIYWYIYRKHA